MTIAELSIHCDHVERKSAVHCNRYRRITIDIEDSPREAIEQTDWGVVDGEVRCPDHV